MVKKIGYVMAYRKGHNNYGTSLQGFALLKKMQQIGCDVEIINYEKHLSFWDKVAYVVNTLRCGEYKRLFRNSKREKYRKENSEYNRIMIDRTKAVDAYKEKKLIPFFKNYKGFAALCEGSKNYEAVVVGSDQVWTPLSLPNKFFNLIFVDDSVRKIAYASSFGVSVIPDFQKAATGVYLNRFYKVGVREQRGKEIVETLSKNPAKVVADPTLLLTRDEWIEQICENISESTESNIKESENTPYIFCYLLGSNPAGRHAALELQRKTGYRIISVQHMDDFIPDADGFGDVAPAAMDPNDFIRYISRAAYVCTDSFHCSVFSTIFHRQFMTFYRFAKASAIGRNSRIDSLFAVLGINREHIYDGDISKIDSRIDWDTVEINLEKLRQESIEFLKEALAQNETERSYNHRLNSFRKSS